MSLGRLRYQILVGGGFALSAFFLWVALRQVDSKSLKEAFSAMKYFPLMLCAGGLYLGILLRGIRWRLVAGFPASQQHGFSRATNMGVLANLIFPGRAGEFIRVITLTRLSQSSLSSAVASMLMDRMLDIFVLVISASILYWLLPIAALLGKWLTFILLFACVMTLLIILYARSSGLGEAWIAKFAEGWLQRWQLRPVAFLAEIRVEFRRILRSWLSIELLLLVILILIVDYASLAFLLRAFALSLPFAAPLLLWVFFAASSALPSAPGYVGVYQIATVWALSIFSVAAPIAIAIATVLQITTLAVVLVMTGQDSWGIIKRILLVKDPFDKQSRHHFDPL